MPQAHSKRSRPTQKTKGDANDAAYTGLAIAMRTVIDVLGKVLGADDPRWLAFGLNMPGANVTPSQPINVTATVDAFGSTILVTCDAVALATRYRARMLRVGVEAEYQLVASGIEPMLSIGGVLAGQTVKIVVQAVNGQVQGVPSAPVEITVALAKTAAAAAAAVVPEVTAFDTSAAPASNGSRNGHAEVVSARG